MCVILFVTVCSAGEPDNAAATAPWEPLADMERQLTLSERDKAILSAVRDRTSQLDEAGLDMMLGRVGGLAELSPEQMADLDQPAYKNLLRLPEKYRGQPIRLTFYAFTVAKLMPADLISSPRDWPADRPVWRILGTLSKQGPKTSKPVYVLSTVEPTILGKPDRVDPDGEESYNHGRRVELACVFYKVYKSLDRGEKGAEPTMREYPLVLAWQIAPAADSPDSSVAGRKTTLMIVIAVAMAIGVLLLRKNIKHLKKTALRPPAARHRRQHDETPPGRPVDSPQQDDSDPIDPLLKAASEEYRRKEMRERQSGDGTEHQD